MIFKELILKDFLSFKGLNRITFPNVSESKSSLVLVLAANNSGKTNIIRALRFLLYGDFLGHYKDPYKLINDGTLNEAKSNIEAWVQATLIDNNKPLTFRRRIQAIKVGNNYKVISNNSLDKIIHGPKGDKYETDGGRIERNLRWLVPEGLFDYFYFQGEELGRQLMEGSGKMSIEKGLSMLLHKDDWKRAIENVTAVRGKFAQDLMNLVSSNKEYQRILQSSETFKLKEKQCKDDLEKALSEKKQTERAFSDISDKIIELSKGGPSQALAELLKKRQNEWRVNSREIDNLDGRICKVTGDSKGIPFLAAAFDTAKEVLEKMQAENLLPADITEGFVERLLKRQKCICGRSLHPVADRNECKHVEEYRDRSLSADVNAGLLALLNSLETSAKHGYKKRITDIAKLLSELTVRRQQCIVKQHDLNQEIQDIEQQLSDPIFGEITKLVQKQRELSNRRLEIRNKIQGLERAMQEIKRIVADHEEKLRKLARDSDISKIKDLTQYKDYAQKIEELINASLKMLQRSFHETMQESVKEYYDRVVTDGTRAYIDPDSLLPAIMSPQGEVRKNIGGGQLQLLVLSHIISLCQLRRVLHEQLSEIGVGVGKLDDQSFFLDSIFAPADDVYAKDVANFLHGKARQVLLLLASQQWHDSVRNAIEPYVDKAYQFLYHTANPKRTEEEYIVKFKNKDIPLLKLIADNNKGNHCAYSIIKEIK